MAFREHILRVHVWLVAGAVPLLVRFCSLETLLRLATPAGSWRPYGGISPERIAAVVRRRLRRPRHMRRRACLRLGLTLFHFLRLAGAPAALHIGAFATDRARKPIGAHCWVSLHGAAVTDGPARPMAVLVEHPTSS